MKNTFKHGYVPDAEQKRCYDCGHMEAHVSWWCTNKDAVAFRGTAIPGSRGCSFWKPADVLPEPLTTRIWLYIKNMIGVTK